MEKALPPEIENKELDKTETEQAQGEPEQTDFTLVNYVVIYQGMKRDGFKFDGEDKVLTDDPRKAARRVMEYIVAQDPQIAHIRTIEVQIPDSEDYVKFFKREDEWPPDPEIGPCISAGPIPIDRRQVRAVVQVERRAIITKDKTTVLNLALRITGNQAVTAERALLDFKSGEDLLMTIVAAQSDLVRGVVPNLKDKSTEVAFDMVEDDETVPVENPEEKSDVPAPPSDVPEGENNVLEEPEDEDEEDEI